MKRKCEVIKSAEEYGSKYRRFVCIDLENQDEIFKAIADKKKKFWTIVERTLTQNFIYWDCYDKEKINNKTSNITAIKFFDTENTRIYCQEVSTPQGEFFIICAETINKKVQKNNKKIDSLIKKVASYEYEIIK